MYAAQQITSVKHLYSTWLYTSRSENPAKPSLSLSIGYVIAFPEEIQLSLEELTLNEKEGLQNIAHTMDKDLSQAYDSGWLQIWTLEEWNDGHLDLARP